MHGSHCLYIKVENSPDDEFLRKNARCTTHTDQDKPLLVSSDKQYVDSSDLPDGVALDASFAKDAENTPLS